MQVAFIAPPAFYCPTDTMKAACCKCSKPQPYFSPSCGLISFVNLSILLEHDPAVSNLPLQTVLCLPNASEIQELEFNMLKIHRYSYAERLEQRVRALFS